MRSTFVLIVSIATFVVTVQACGKTKDNNNNNNGGTAAPGKEKILQRSMGPDTTAERYDPSGFDSEGGGPVEDGDDLECDFSGDCCWANEPDPIPWRKGSGPTDDGRLDQAFGTDDGPSGDFLTAYTESDDDGEARFHSCVLECAEETTVSLRHWQTDGTRLQVCLRDIQDDDESLTDCKTISSSDQPGPTEVKFNKKIEMQEVVIVAKNFNDEEGNLVAIDDIEVETEPCPDTTTTEETTTEEPTTREPTEPTPAPNDDDICQKLSCNFNSDSCNYQASSGGQTAGRTGNLDTGVLYGPNGEGDGYMGTEVNPGQTATIKSQSFTATRQYQVRFKYWEVTDQLIVRGNDQDVSPLGVSTADRQWKDGSIDVNPGDNEVDFVGNNQGREFGAFGIDDVEVYDENGRKINC